MSKNEKEKKETKEKKHSKKIIPTIIFIIGILIGGSIILIGVKNVVSDLTAKDNTASVEEKLEELNKRDEELASEETKIDSEITKEFSTNGFSEEYYEKVEQREKIYSERTEISEEKFDLENQSVINNNSVFNIFYFFFGAIVIIAFGIISSGMTKSQNIQENITNGLGILSSLNKKDTYKNYKCPNCGASLKGQEDEEVCAYCGTKLHKS